ncbi:MAG TPA: thioredoxin [Ohtaekwangia sp.]|nr:thioredoxin [Ohtaekwangia sp.]
MEEKKSFNDLVNGDKPVLVDFTATWCGPCKMMQPILQELASRIGDKASIIKIDVDKNQALAQSFQIQGVPTLMVFKQGKVHWRQSGVMNANQLEQVINQFLEEPVKG